VFTFTASDLSPVNLQCKLSGNASGGYFVGVQNLGAWESCSSPQVCTPATRSCASTEPSRLTSSLQLSKPSTHLAEHA